MSNYNDTDDKFDDMYDEATEPVKKTAKRTAKSLIKKAAKAMIRAIKSAVMFIVSSFGAIIGPVLIVALLSYFILFEFTGTEKEYSKDYENETELTEEGIEITKEENMRDENKIIKDFYKYFAGQSYYQILGDDVKNLRKPDDDNAVRDFYGRENLYKLTPNFLYSLDSDVYDGDWKYPEQFIKPVNFDEEKLELKDLTNKEAQDVSVVSKEIDMETGKETGKELVSVKDYGLASVLAYNTTEDWERMETLRGTYDKQDVWDSASQSVVTVPINPEPFEIEVLREDIHLIEKVINFKETKEFKYKYQEDKVRGLASGTSSDAKSEVQSIEYGTHIVTTYVRDSNGNVMNDEEGNPIVSSSTTYKLYKHRSADSGVFENKPVLIEDSEEDKDKNKNKNRDYLVDYLTYFETDIPEATTKDFVFDERIDYDSYVFDEGGALKDDASFDLGSGTNQKKFETASQYLPIMKKHAAEFGTDPYVILAMITLESGGNPNINSNGISQITGSPTIKVKNKDGQMVRISLSQAEKKDVDKSLRFATAYHKHFLDLYNGDIYKAITAYNQGAGGMKKIKELNPAAWDNGLEWLKYREASRIYWGKKELGTETRSANYSFFPFPEGVRTKAQYPIIYGNSNYLEMVLQYYPKGGQTDIDYTTGSDVKPGLGGAISGLFKKFVNIFSKEEDVPHIKFDTDLTDDAIKDTLMTVNSFDNDLLFSDSEGYEGNISFWQEGFVDNLGISTEINADAKPNPEGFICPLPPGFRISSHFGYRTHPITGQKKLHAGIDLPAPIGSPVYASKGGVVVWSKWWGSGGNAIRIDHGGGIETLYLHLNKSHVNTGDTVVTGQRIADVGNTGGSTGPHLHFEYRVNNKPQDPINIVNGKTINKAN